MQVRRMTKHRHSTALSLAQEHLAHQIGNKKLTDDQVPLYEGIPLDRIIVSFCALL
jgi:hypothetical protein